MQHGMHDGTCRRRAPRPADRADQITHWPTTLSRERCGDGVLREVQMPALVSCGQCRFWRTNPGGGLNPLDRRDERRACGTVPVTVSAMLRNHPRLQAAVASGGRPMSTIPALRVRWLKIAPDRIAD